MDAQDAQLLPSILVPLLKKKLVTDTITKQIGTGKRNSSCPLGLLVNPFNSPLVTLCGWSFVLVMVSADFCLARW
jgi:hypothetical protein